MNMNKNDIENLADRLHNFDGDKLQREMTDGLEQWCQQRLAHAQMARRLVASLLLLLTLSAVAMTTVPNLRHAVFRSRTEVAVADTNNTAEPLLFVEPVTPPQSADEADMLMDAQSNVAMPPEMPQKPILEPSRTYDFVAVTAQGDSLFCTVIRTAKTVKVSLQHADVLPNGSIDIPSKVMNDGLWYTVTALADSALANCRDLRKVTLPATLTHIGRDAFNGCSMLDTLCTSSLRPPSIVGEWCFWEVPQEAILIVPCRSGASYRSAHCWDWFESIVDTCEAPPLPEYPKPIIKFNGNHLIVEGVFGEVIRVYDFEGRLIASELCNGQCRISIGTGLCYHSTSAFLVQVGDSPAIKVSAPLRNSTATGYSLRWLY